MLIVKAQIITMLRRSIIVAVIVAVTGCASSPKVAVEKRSDASLSCDQIQAELSELDQIDRQIDKNARPSGAKVAAAVIWLPGLAYTLSDARKAQELSWQRRSRLNQLAQERNCR